RIRLSDSRFTSDDWGRLRESGHACWLLAIPQVDMRSLEGAVQAYLREGISRGLHLTPTAQRLKYWYALPLPKRPPDLFITYLFRDAPAFVMNCAKVLHLTNVLCGRLGRN